MELKKIRVCSVLLVLVLLLMATEKMGPMVAEARTCESRSNHHKGSCFHHSNCAISARLRALKEGSARAFAVDASVPKLVKRMKEIANILEVHKS